MKIKEFAIFILVISIAWGCDQSGDKKTNVNDQNPQKEQLKSPANQNTPASEVDKFGRKPGDQHYGHNHPSDEHSNQKTDTMQKPALGEQDKYGRKLGDPHYGHNHQ